MQTSGVQNSTTKTYLNNNNNNNKDKSDFKYKNIFKADNINFSNK
jgi:hypothetical protein